MKHLFIKFYDLPALYGGNLTFIDFFQWTKLVKYLEFVS